MNKEEDKQLGASMLTNSEGNASFFYVTDFNATEDGPFVVIETILSKTDKAVKYEFGLKKYYELTYGEFQRLKEQKVSKHTLMEYICLKNR